MNTQLAIILTALAITTASRTGRTTSMACSDCRSTTKIKNAGRPTALISTYRRAIGTTAGGWRSISKAGPLNAKAAPTTALMTSANRTPR